MGVDHRGVDAGMAEQLLDGADVGAGFDQMGGEGVTERVAGHALVDSRPTDSGPDGAIDAAGIEMMASPGTGAGID